jgi:hypothetical protein
MCISLLFVAFFAQFLSFVISSPFDPFFTHESTDPTTFYIDSPDDSIYEPVGSETEQQDLLFPEGSDPGLGTEPQNFLFPEGSDLGLGIEQQNLPFPEESDLGFLASDLGSELINPGLSPSLDIALGESGLYPPVDLAFEETDSLFAGSKCTFPKQEACCTGPDYTNCFYERARCRGHPTVCCSRVDDVSRKGVDCQSPSQVAFFQSEEVNPLAQENFVLANEGDWLDFGNNR